VSIVSAAFPCCIVRNQSKTIKIENDMAEGREINMDEQDRQDGNYLVLVRDLLLTRRVAQNSPAIVVPKETCTLSCSSMLVPLATARSVISKN